ncbi:MAG: GntR family transcriptional regulator [Betaproteobacteria bacterium]
MTADVATQGREPGSEGLEVSPRSSLSDDVYNALKWRILTLELRPGGLFREEDLCKLLGYGRSPVHQAVHRLKYDGLVDIIPRKGVIVRAYSAREINDLIEARLPIEMEMARLAAARATPEKISRLRERLAQGPELLARGDREGLMVLDRAFHRGVAECTGNQVLIDVLEQLHQRSMILWFVSVSSDGRQYDIVQEEHEQILDCIASGDGEAAAQSMRRHLEPFLRR